MGSADKNPNAQANLPEEYQSLPDHPMLAEIKLRLNEATEAAIQTLHEGLADGAAPMSDEVRSAHLSTLKLMNDTFHEQATSMFGGAVQAAQVLAHMDPATAQELMERALFALRSLTAFYAEIAAQVHCFANIGRPVLVDQTVLPAGAELVQSIIVKVNPHSAPDHAEPSRPQPVRPN